MEVSNEDLNELELQQELFKYSYTSFQLACNGIMREISTKLKNLGFIDKYMEYYHNEASEEELVAYIHDVLIDLDEYERHDLNHMHKMMSTYNCGWYEYRVGEFIHKELLKIWYPEDKE